jgi:hypothetical protein
MIKVVDNFRLDLFIRDEKIVCIKLTDLKSSEVFMDRWMDGKVAYSNKQKCLLL